MPLYPKFKAQQCEQLVTEVFGGCDHRLRIAEGDLYDSRNLTTDFAPMIAPRAPRGLTGRRARALAEKDALAYVGEDGTLYYNWLPTGLTGLSAGEKQLVALGAVLCVFPDKVYLNTADLSDHGSMEASFSGGALYRMCRSDGTVFTPAVSVSAPASPANGDYWIDCSAARHALRQWSAAAQDWVAVETARVKISFSSGGLAAAFRALDGVEISGSSIEGLNGEKVVCDLGDDWIMVEGLIESVPAARESLTIRRTVPDLDFVCECQNRLWGCRYGLGEDGMPLNEICCSALGDFRNWRQFRGLSTDSWAASVGSDGQWTGAVNYLGYPTFFKENRIHRVSVSPEGAHRVDETVCRGVQKGSAKSLAVVNETLYYKSPSDVCAWQGGFPQGISLALGPHAAYHAAVAGAVGGKYYVSMLDETDTPQLFVYDASRALWLHEDHARATDFARVDGELYAVVDGEIVAMLGSLPALEGARAEETPSWAAVGGIETLVFPENKRLSRYQLRLNMERGASVSVYLRYDAPPADADTPLSEWTLAGSVSAGEDGVGRFLLPVRARRCAHLQLALFGTGAAQLCSIARILEVGSDYR
ncbi:MAG: hypothetical protein IJH48_07870 [Oscillospiraceae bacterium]|nr:hypothetical protein [Oscillospiraceae bacterium]